ncbi:MAG: hypothetical protein FWG41_05330, partial [Methanomassiliicoccaceae archaeon]|nr:hypothetical protein [Methanomassiliicoccaceae archaeon]
GNITITGGTITASGGGTMGSGGAGIGGGNNGTGGIITITGGTVTANAGGLAAGIGGGGPGGMPGGGTGGIITITGGRVTANGGTSAAGIGGGGLAGGGTILIYGEQTYVSAVGGAQSLGNGTGGTGGNVFALVMYENLRGTGDSILGTARFTAAPWSYDTVKAILPAPFGVTIELFEGLTAETWMSLQTTLTSPTLIDFVLDDYDNSPVAKAVASFASATDNLVAFSTSYNTITVTLEGDGYVEVGQGGKTYGTVTVSGSEVYVPTRVTDVVLTAVPGAGSVFVKWKEDLSGINPVYNLSIGSDIFVTAEFGIISPTPTTRNYYITATADAGATVSPAGQRTVQKGDSAAFAFSAKEGYSISAVIVDGVQLSRTEIGKGYYTFTNVQANHTIEVKSIAGPRTDMFLSISIVEGNGRAEYSVNNSAFVVYTATVGLPDHADLVVIAYAADGYQFVRWETPAVYTTPEISFNDVMAGIHLDVYFTSDDSPAFEISWITLVIIAIILLLLAGILLWLIFFHRRYYEIKIEGSSRIIGEERVHRKSAYTFAVEGGYSGIIVYRVGEDGEWRPLSPGADGKYVIPRNEVTDNIYLEERNQ